MTPDELRDALAAMLDAMPADLRATCVQEIHDGEHPHGVQLHHRTGRRYEAVWAGRHIGTVFLPASFWAAL